jgi:hypothetical protein
MAAQAKVRVMKAMLAAERGNAKINLSTAVNWAYYRLGEAWYDFCLLLCTYRIVFTLAQRFGNIYCLVLQTYVQVDCWLSRTSQSQRQHLATLLPAQTVSGALRKRLVRAKKYWSLVHRYSTRLLALVPVVSCQESM